MSPKLTLHAVNDNFRTFKALIASEYSGTKVEVAEGVLGPVKSGDYLKVNPLGKFPALEVDKEVLTESNAIAFYLSNSQLRGGDNILHQSQVLQWLLFADNEILPSALSWVLPILGVIEVDKSVIEKGKADLKKRLEHLNKHLLTKTWLVGERLTLADIVVGCSLLRVYQVVLDPNTRKPFANVNRWFTTFVNQPQVKAVLGEVKLNEKEGVSTAVAVKKTEAKKQEKKKKEPKPAAAAAAPEDDEDDDGIPKEKPQKDPFEAFPKGTFNMDEFKRFYSNNPEDQAIDFFWQKFDKENYSIWYGEYKYPEDLTMVFMSCNLMSGMMQRLDRMRKHAFGSLLLFGEDHKSQIAQLWIWRGQQLAFELSDDWMVDYESYTWKKIDPDSDEAKKLIKEYFTWEGDFGGKKFNQGKIFK